MEVDNGKGRTREEGVKAGLFSSLDLIKTNDTSCPRVGLIAHEKTSPPCPHVRGHDTFCGR